MIKSYIRYRSDKPGKMICCLRTESVDKNSNTQINALTRIRQYLFSMKATNVSRTAEKELRGIFIGNQYITNTLISETIDTIVSRMVRHFVLYFRIFSPPLKIPKTHTFVCIIKITISGTFLLVSQVICKIMQFPFLNQRIQCS